MILYKIVLGDSIFITYNVILVYTWKKRHTKRGMSFMIKVGIIGCGSITRHRHAPEYKNNEKCVITAFSDPVLKRAEELAEIYNARAYSDYRDIINDPDINAVSVCSSNDMHAKISIEALNAGKHVLCEKPMAINTEEARKMLEASRESGKFLMIGHNQRLIAAHIKAKEILKQGELGEVISFRTSFKHAGPEGWSVDKSNKTWFFKKQAAYFGVLGDLGIHKVDLIQWLLCDRINEVNALTVTMDKRYENDELISVEDNAICMFKTERGRIGTMETSWTNYGKQDNSTIVYCKNGVMKIYNQPDFDIAIEMNKGSCIYYKIENTPTNAQMPNSGVIDAFIESIVCGRAPEISGEEGYKALSVIEACLKSSIEGKWIKIE
jgi:predicted dehydrogenase